MGIHTLKTTKNLCCLSLSRSFSPFFRIKYECVFFSPLSNCFLWLHARHSLVVTLAIFGEKFLWNNWSYTFSASTLWVTWPRQFEKERESWSRDRYLKRRNKIVITKIKNKTNLLQCDIQSMEISFDGPSSVRCLRPIIVSMSTQSFFVTHSCIRLVI